MNFPDNLEEFINNIHGQDERVMEIYMIDPEYEDNNNLLSWSLESFDS